MSNEALQNNDVAAVAHQVRVALSRAERAGRSGPLFVEPARADQFGINPVRRHSEVIVDRPSGSARPLVGPAITFAKRVFRRLVRWYAKPVAQQQTHLNQQMLAVSEKIGQSLAKTQATVGDLSMRLDMLERAIDAIEVENHASAAPAAPVPPGEHADVTASVQKLLAYKAFEDRHRGSAETVRTLLEPYVQHYAGCRRVLDLGCGRGEFVGLLAERGISAYGIDSDASQVEAGQEAGRDVRLEDAVAHLRGLRTGEVDGVFSSQVAEHLTTTQLVSGIDLVHRKLAPGGVLVMETPNPEALFIFATFFYVDLTHIKPIHPEALRWAFEACGFEDVTVVRSQRVPDSARLTPIPAELREQPGWDVLARNTDMLNDLVYGFQHYAVVGRKSEVPE